MNYQDELKAKLDAAHHNDAKVSHAANRYDASDVDQMIVDELTEEFNLSRYDLHESDILRAIKIEAILEPYREVFKKLYALKIFYAIGKAGTINLVTLQAMINRPEKNFQNIISRMMDSNLLELTENEELTLTDEGKSLAERIGVDIFI